MDNIYGKYFFNEFYENNGGGNYNKKEMWEPFFEQIAQNIVERFNPKTVLDAGCAMGYLVSALRKKGVEAYGFDISEYAISNVSEEVKPYCFVHSITEKLPNNIPQTFDLVITIEVLEHLFPEEGSKAIKNLCNYSDTIIFTSTPDDIEDITHVNVQQPEYWCKEFAKNSFFRDLILPVDFICKHAMLFRKKNNFENVIFDYEINNRIANINLEKLSSEKEELSIENADLKNNIMDLSAERNNLKDKIRDLSIDNGTYKEELMNVAQIKEKYDNLRRDFDKLNRDYNIIINAQWWKITKPFRLMGIALRRLIGFNGIHENPVKISNKELNLQRKTKFKNPVKFSILVPLYNTNEKFLKKLIESVRKQTYSNWELCFADGSDESHSFVERICKKYAHIDKRIKYKKLDENLGISENTNACIKMATGDYIALLDHDDVLHPSALFEVEKTIDGQGADFIYTDEAVFEDSLNKIKAMHFKTDFTVDNLRAYNYICHFTVFKKDLLDEVGIFRKEFDGSQDHDMVLRLTEKAKKIIHIPKILYFWRSHKESVAYDISSKSYAIENGIKAVKAHLDRCGLQGEVESSKVCPTLYRIKYKINGNPLVSILIPNKDHIADLDRCIKSIINKSTYKNFEIIVIENNSVVKETFEYYKALESNEKIKVVEWKDKKFNYSEINNFGAKFAKGKHLILLNNDTEIIEGNWIEEMLMFSQRKDVGAVGAKLYYPSDDTVQHGGVVIGIGGIAGHVHTGFKRTDPGYMSRLGFAQELSAVTGACMMIPRHVFEEVGGLDKSFEVAFNDIDLCMRIRKAGYKVIWTPHAELYHYESKSRGYEDTLEKQRRFKREIELFKKRWAKELKDGDPFYNPNLTLDRGDFSLK